MNTYLIPDWPLDLRSDIFTGQWQPPLATPCSGPGEQRSFRGRFGGKQEMFGEAPGTLEVINIETPTVYSGNQSHKNHMKSMSWKPNGTWIYNGCFSTFRKYVSVRNCEQMLCIFPFEEGVPDSVMTFQSKNSFHISPRRGSSRQYYDLSVYKQFPYFLS